MKRKGIILACCILLMSGCSYGKKDNLNDNLTAETKLSEEEKQNEQGENAEQENDLTDELAAEVISDENVAGNDNDTENEHNSQEESTPKEYSVYLKEKEGTRLPLETFEEEGAIYALKCDNEYRGSDGLYGNKELFIIMNLHEYDIYLYNFETDELKYLQTIQNGLLQGGGRIVKDGKMYFHIGQMEDEDTTINVLYEVDFEKETIRSIAANSYYRKLIPMELFNGNIYMLQGDEHTFLEMMDADGNITKLIEETEINTTWTNMACDGEYLYIVEHIFDEKSTIGVNICKYDKSMTLLGKTDISELINERGMSGNFSVFEVFDGYLYFRDYSWNGIMGRMSGDEVEVLMEGNIDEQLSYVHEEDGYTGYRYFYKRETNEIYRLNPENGEIKTYVLELDTEDSHIGYISGDNEKLLVDKIKNSAYEPDGDWNIYRYLIEKPVD